MRFLATLSGAVLALVMTATAVQAAELVTNGDFATGDFTGWTLYTTASGSLGPAPAPQVSSFDVTGSGASLAAELQVGREPNAGAHAGGGIFQSITTVNGLLTFSADFASFASTIANQSGGLFSVLLDGVTLNSFDTGSIDDFAIERGTLAFSTLVTAGTHVLSLQATRPFTTGSPNPLYGRTPFQYFDNISATQGAVPEPATWGLMIMGFGLAGGALRRRARIANLA